MVQAWTILPEAPLALLPKHKNEHTAIRQKGVLAAMVARFELNVEAEYLSVKTLGSAEVRYVQANVTGLSFVEVNLHRR